MRMHVVYSAVNNLPDLFVQVFDKDGVDVAIKELNSEKLGLFNIPKEIKIRESPETELWAQNMSFTLK